MFAKYKKIIIVVLILVLGFLVWSIFINKSPEEEDLLVSEKSSEVSKLGTEIINTLSRIKKIELKKDVFENPVFIRLQDYSKEIIPQDVGRLNPFEPFEIPDGPLSGNNDIDLEQDDPTPDNNLDQ